MVAYATTEDVGNGFREMSKSEEEKCEYLLDEASAIIKAYCKDTDAIDDDLLKIVSCRMVRRVLGDGKDMVNFPVGSTQGSMSALGYSQSFTINNGSVGELYLSKIEKKMLGIGDHIGTHSPLEDL